MTNPASSHAHQFSSSDDILETYTERHWGRHERTAPSLDRADLAIRKAKETAAQILW